jgi:hypothetical protein
VLVPREGATLESICVGAEDAGEESVSPLLNPGSTTIGPEVAEAAPPQS